MIYKLIVIFNVALYVFSSCNNNLTNPTPNNSPFVTIGSQVWMRKNLDVDHYRNGDSIPEVRDSMQWAKLKTGAWCYYNNDPAMGAIYGKLYNWYAVNDSRGLAPLGQHIPSDSEWKILVNFLGGDYNASDKLKEAGTLHWQSPNTHASNESGFTALPGGIRYNDNGKYVNIGERSCWWSSKEINEQVSVSLYLTYDRSSLGWFCHYKEYGFSVRCLKD
ncbi:MAG: hypothetical protein HW421_3346 [Ignavibacteria bacterium]|nr:hypothetical protein [Ignavibacteria bacterium]